MSGTCSDKKFRRGIPLLRARWTLVPIDIWQPALIANARRANLSWPDGALGSLWMYEVFVCPRQTQSLDAWARWDRQEADPLVRAEVERQSTFYLASLDLGRRLLTGELQGFGRVGSLAGEWKAIPPKAWHVLKVGYGGSFQEWGLGHATGGGLDLWDVSILDMSGLSIDAASIAYGPDGPAATTQRALAFGVAQPNCDVSPRGLLNEKAERARRNPKLGPDSDQIREEIVQSALEDLDNALLVALSAGRLIAEALDENGNKCLIPRTVWNVPKLSVARDIFGSDAWEAITIRPPSDSLMGGQHTQRTGADDFEAQRDAAPHVSGRKQSSQKTIEREYLAWAKDQKRTKPDADEWAKQNGYSTTIVRPLHSKYGRSVGRPKMKSASNGHE